MTADWAWVVGWINETSLKEAIPFLYFWIHFYIAGFLFCSQLELFAKQNRSTLYWPVKVFSADLKFSIVPRKPCKRYGFADKIISQRESRALNLMSISFLLTYVISYWPLLGFHILRCFEYEGLSAKVCQKSLLNHS